MILSTAIVPFINAIKLIQRYIQVFTCVVYYYCIEGLHHKFRDDFVVIEINLWLISCLGHILLLPMTTHRRHHHHHSVTVNLQPMPPSSLLHGHVAQVEYDDYIHFLNYGIINEKPVVHDRAKFHRYCLWNVSRGNKARRCKEHSSRSLRIMLNGAVGQEMLLENRSEPSCGLV